MAYLQTQRNPGPRTWGSDSHAATGLAPSVNQMVSGGRQPVLSPEHGACDALGAGAGFGAAKTVDGVVIYSARAWVRGAKAAIFTSSTCPVSARAATMESMGSRARTGAPIWSASSSA